MTIEEISEWMAGANDEGLWELCEALIMEYAARGKYIVVTEYRLKRASATYEVARSMGKRGGDEQAL